MPSSMQLPPPMPSTLLRIGLGWDPADGAAEDVDLDLCCIVFDRACNALELVHFNHLTSNDGIITHSGDHRTGDGPGDDEAVHIAYANLHREVHALAFVATSYTRDGFERVRNVRVRAMLADTMQQLFEEPVNVAAGSESSVLVGVLYREGTDCLFDSTQMPVPANTFVPIIQHLQSSEPFLTERFHRVTPGTGGILFKLPTDLRKGESFKLKTDLPSHEQITLGLGWDVARNKQIDLDVSCVCFDAHNQVVETVFFGRLATSNGSIRHSGDNVTGEGDGDDEQLYINFSRIPASTTALVLVINSYRGTPFRHVRNAFVRAFLPATNEELVRFHLSEFSTDHTALVVCKLQRLPTTKGTWVLTALGHATHGRVYKDSLPVMEQALASSGAYQGPSLPQKRLTIAEVKAMANRHASGKKTRKNDETGTFVAFVLALFLVMCVKSLFGW